MVFSYRVKAFNLYFFLELCCTLQNSQVQHFTLQFLNLKQMENPSETCMFKLGLKKLRSKKQGNGHLRVA